MSSLSSHQALELTASFAFTAERMRAGSDSQARASLYERASRIAFLRAYRIARDEEACPAFGQIVRRAVFALA
jgi:hypothetical protein